MGTTFDERAFAAALRAGDSRRFKIDLKTNRDPIINAAIHESQFGTGPLGKIHKSEVKGKLCHSLNNYPQVLILRLLARYLSRRLRIETPNRDRLVTAVIEALTDSTPMIVIRRDILSFYESIPTVKLQRKLLNELLTPAAIHRQLARYFETFCSENETGLPRGISLSSVIADHAMADFDKSIRELPNVYRYLRYSDDILIFATGDADTIDKKIHSSLPAGMALNESKSQVIEITQKRKKDPSIQMVEYLGYKFTFLDDCGSREPRTVSVSISDRKIKKLKSKLFCSIKAFKKDRDFNLLLNRIRFLSGNYSVLRKGVTTIKTSRFVKSGIYYNYRLCGVYAETSREEHKARELKSLDGFYHSLLKPTALLGSLLGTSQLQELKRISFFKGFTLKITHDFSIEEVASIKMGWRRA